MKREQLKGGLKENVGGERERHLQSKDLFSPDHRRTSQSTFKSEPSPCFIDGTSCVVHFLQYFLHTCSWRILFLL